MNQERIASLLRELAVEFETLDAQAPKPRPKALRKRRSTRAPIVPVGEISELDRARAAKDLRRMGYKV